jgi:hypothetical protein
MKIFRILRALVLPCFVLSIAACDPGGSEGSESGDSDGWSRVLDIDSFSSTVVYRHSYGGCSYVRTYEAIDDGEACSTGTLHVADDDVDGDLVAGGFTLCGTMRITTDHDEACHGADETTMQPLADVGFIELSAADAEAPMTMRWRWADGLVLEAEIESARALEAGEETTFRFVDAEAASDGAQREVSVDAEIVMFAEPEEFVGCGAAPGMPGAQTLRCG